MEVSVPLTKKGIHWYLTDEEVMFIRDQLKSLRANGVYEPGKWFVSGFNRKPEVLGATLPAHMPKKVVLRDITLRSAGQTLGVMLGPAERLRLVRALLDIGVSAFEVSRSGFGQAAQETRAEIDLIKSVNPEAEIKVGAANTKDLIDDVADLGATIISLQGPANVATTLLKMTEVRQMAWEGKDWRRQVGPAKSLKEMIERNKPIIEYAKKRGIKVEAELNMLLYAREEEIETYAREMGNAEVDDIFLADGPGGMGPQAIAYAFGIAKKAAPKTKIVTHLHNSFNLGVANNIAAVHAGAEVLEVSVNGYGPAAGQTDLGQMAAALELLYGVDTGIRLEQLTALRRLGEEITGVLVAYNHPITGDSYFVWTAGGSLSVELPVDPLIHWCAEASVFGNKRGLVISQISGVWDMLSKLTELGIPVEKSEVEAILKEVKEELRIRRRALTDDEIRTVALTVQAVAR